MGVGKRGAQVNVIDFGLAKTNLHIPYREDKKFIGTARYASTSWCWCVRLSIRPKTQLGGLWVLDSCHYAMCVRLLSNVLDYGELRH